MSRSSFSRTSIELGAVGQERVELVDRHELERLRAAAEHVAGDVEDRDGAKTADGVPRLVLVRRGDHDGPFGSSTNAAFVAKRVPETGTLTAP